MFEASCSVYILRVPRVKEDVARPRRQLKQVAALLLRMERLRHQLAHVAKVEPPHRKQRRVRRRREVPPNVFVPIERVQPGGVVVLIQSEQDHERREAVHRANLPHDSRSRLTQPHVGQLHLERARGAVRQLSCTVAAGTA